MFHLLKFISFFETNHLPPLQGRKLSEPAMNDDINKMLLRYYVVRHFR
jgi:hypothetical protein